MKDYTEELGVHELIDQPVFLYANVRASYDNPETWALEIFFNKINEKTGETERHVVARIDNRSHDGNHVDELYKQEESRKFLDISFWESWKTAQEKWRNWTTEYIRNHFRE